MNLSVVKPRGQQAKGYFMAIIASITYGLNPLFAVPLYGMGLDVLSVLFYRYLFASIILGLIMPLMRCTFKVPRKAWLPLVFAGIFFGISSITLFASYRYMDVGIASTILYVTPFFVAFLMWMLYKQKISLAGLMCVIVSMGGIAMISVKQDSTIQNPVGILLVVLASLAYAIYVILINRTALNQMHIVPLTFYCLVVGLVLFAVCAGFGRDLVAIPATLAGVANILGIAIFPTIVSILTMTVAIQAIGPVPTSVLEAFEPVVALFIGCLLFGETLTPLNIVGIVVILLAVTYFVVSQQRR